MSCYFVAQIKIHDPEEYQKYLDTCDEVFDRFHGEYLAVDSSPLVLEGEWRYSKSVIIKFPDKQAFDDWYYSEEYQRILKFRLNASSGESILVEGINP